MIPQFSIISHARVRACVCLCVCGSDAGGTFSGNEISGIIRDYCKGHLDTSYLRRCERSNNLTFL